MRPPRGRIPPARRRLGLTAEEAALWQRVVAGVVPLRPAAAAGEDAVASLPPPAATAPPAAAPVPPAPPLPDLAIGLAPAGLDRRRWDDLRRGRTRPERTLDLHGLSAAAAHAAVCRFVRAAHAAGLRCIAIITGKGAGEGGGVLRRELPHWLNAPELRRLILAAAHPHRANPGAVHLLLRRRRVEAGDGRTG